MTEVNKSSKEVADDRKPCPFCGRYGLRACQEYTGDRDNGKYFVECMFCDCCGPTAETTDLAVAAWNRRPADETSERWIRLSDLECVFREQWGGEGDSPGRIIDLLKKFYEATP